MLKFLRCFYFILLTALSACIGKENGGVPDLIPENKVTETSLISTPVYRFEQDLFSIKKETFTADTLRLFSKYGDFPRLFTSRIIKVGNTQTPLFMQNLLGFLNDPTIHEVFTEVEKKYSDISTIQTEISDALKRFHIIFPDTAIPKVLTMVTGFNYNIVIDDATLGIGLDMYLGEKSKYYEWLHFDKYKTRNMRPEQIVPDAIRALLMSTFENTSTRQDLLTAMMYHGKILFLSQQLLKNQSEESLLGYTTEQLQWCKDNEAKIWSHFIDKKLFYSTDFKQQINYINDGPFTPGLGDDSPAKLGVWLGLQIVKSYMSKNDISLPGMIYNQDAHEQFKISGYKPGRI